MGVIVDALVTNRHFVSMAEEEQVFVKKILAPFQDFYKRALSITYIPFN